eukprot:CAMPEP_0197554406 /NCGR_PEP_ID=MMETSP1320-20131121/11285_1 /TAXON_ID=91990 /ORGANISM="Bolidomonas sp., Strain RCC2347" /LENGTH=64 /DNA_ID=CAMNT_0043115285 /DNA_START=87 /DNA_END=277 /DNA_ORIENTATION=+
MGNADSSPSSNTTAADLNLIQMFQLGTAISNDSVATGMAERYSPESNAQSNTGGASSSTKVPKS